MSKIIVKISKINILNKKSPSSFIYIIPYLYLCIRLITNPDHPPYRKRYGSSRFSEKKTDLLLNSPLKVSLTLRLFGEPRITPSSWCFLNAIHPPSFCFAKRGSDIFITFYLGVNISLNSYSLGFSVYSSFAKGPI